MIPTSERIALLAKTVDDETIKAVLIGVAGIVGRGDRHTLNVLAGVMARFSAYAMWREGVSFQEAEAIAEAEEAQERSNG